MNKELKDIKGLINNGETKLAIEKLTELLTSDIDNKDIIYYLFGNAYRKMNNWQGALNNYQEAININPDSPAKDAREMMMNIINFYNKDMYNQ